MKWCHNDMPLFLPILQSGGVGQALPIWLGFSYTLFPSPTPQPQTLQANSAKPSKHKVKNPKPKPITSNLFSIEIGFAISRLKPQPYVYINIFKHTFMVKEKFTKGCAPLKCYLSDRCWNIYERSSCLPSQTHFRMCLHPLWSLLGEWKAKLQRVMLCIAATWNFSLHWRSPMSGFCGGTLGIHAWLDRTGPCRCTQQALLPKCASYHQSACKKDGLGAVQCTCRPWRCRWVCCWRCSCTWPCRWRCCRSCSCSWPWSWPWAHWPWWGWWRECRWHWPWCRGSRWLMLKVLGQVDGRFQRSPQQNLPHNGQTQGNSCLRSSNIHLAKQIASSFS